MTLIYYLPYYCFLKQMVTGYGQMLHIVIQFLFLFWVIGIHFFSL